MSLGWGVHTVVFRDDSILCLQLTLQRHSFRKRSKQQENTNVIKCQHVGNLGERYRGVLCIARAICKFENLKYIVVLNTQGE